MSSKLGFQQRLQELASKASELFCGDNNLEVNPNLEKYFTPAFLDLINRHSRQTSCSSEGFSTVEQGFLQEFERLQKMFFPVPEDLVETLPLDCGGENLELPQLEAGSFAEHINPGLLDGAGPIDSSLGEADEFSQYLFEDMSTFQFESSASCYRGNSRVGEELPSTPPKTPSRRASPSLPDSSSRNISSPRSRRIHACNFKGCNAEFTRKADCRRHFDALHSMVSREYKCTNTGCRKTFNRLDNLRAHVRRFHGES